VALTADTTGLGSEAFFAQPYYRSWLDWIKQHQRANASARALNDWLEEENRRVATFVTGYERDESSPERSLKALDIGCGFGRHLVDLTRKHPNLHAVGVDINAGMVAEANRDALRRKVDDRCTFIPGDVSELTDCGSEEFDLAICMTNTLGNLPDRKQAPLLQRLREVLKPGGRVLISVYAPSSVNARMESYSEIGLYVEEKDRRIVAVEGLESEAFEPQDLKMMLERNGFKIVGKVEPVTSLGWQIVASRVE
jgi:ubiquinone/menaquinone biosynthesis C-methylase UbiE